MLCQAGVHAQALKTLGYLGWWLPESWRSVPLEEIDRLLFFEFKVTATGEIPERHGWPQDWGELRSATAQHKTPLDLTLTLFDAGTFNALFDSEQAVQRLLSECQQLANPAFVSGLHLDFEIYSGATPNAIASYRAFIKTLDKYLGGLQPARHLSLFLPANADVALYDKDTLQVMDLVVMQSYDTHYRNSPQAGPVAPLGGPDTLTWQSAAKEGLMLGINADRLVLTFPLYGYEWVVSGPGPRSATKAPGVTTSFAKVSEFRLPEIQTSVTERVQAYGATHDPASGSSYYRFKNMQGEQVEGWFEDWWSLGRKVDFLKQQKLGGVAFFLLGYDKDELVRYYLQRRGPKTFEKLVEMLQ